MIKKLFLNLFIEFGPIISFLIASEIVKNQDKEIVLTINDEGYDIVRNGLETLVKTICDHKHQCPTHVYGPAQKRVRTRS